jgi:pimeloyl-ACP methyl ester carboxylesterase
MLMMPHGGTLAITAGQGYGTDLAPHRRYERIDGPGHWMQLEAPDMVNQLLLDFLPG